MSVLEASLALNVPLQHASRVDICWMIQQNQFRQCGTEVNSDPISLYRWHAKKCAMLTSLQHHNVTSVEEAATVNICQAIRAMSVMAHHGLCGSNKLLYKRWALSMGNGELRPPTAPKFLDRSFWNSNLRNTSRVPPNMQNMVQIRIRGWAGRTPSLSLFLVLPFVFF